MPLSSAAKVGWSVWAWKCLNLDIVLSSIFLLVVGLKSDLPLKLEALVVVLKRNKTFTMPDHFRGQIQERWLSSKPPPGCNKSMFKSVCGDKLGVDLRLRSGREDV
jgi:hypothetical protein